MSNTKKGFILLFIILISFSGYAQSKKINKIEKLYKNEKIEKCLKKSLKYRKKNPRDYKIHEILSRIYLFEFNQNKNLNKKNTFLKKAIKHYDLANRYSENNIEIDIQNIVKEFADSLYNKKYKTKSKFYIKFLADQFNDTSTYYYELYPVKVIKDIPLKTKTHIGNTRDKMLAFAKDLVGIPYVYAGEDTKGFDCSGFTKYTFSSIGVELPHNAHKQSSLGETISLNNAKPGDMVFFGYNHNNSYRVVHAGIIYAKNNENLEIIHCVSRGVQIDDKESDNWQYYWKDRILFVKRIIDD
jgi:cell wall-associated NlpC family hydrolase